MSGLGFENKRRAERANARWEARYSSDCDECGERIAEGELVRWEGREVVHADCAPPEAETTEVCERCFMAVAVNGACGCDE